MNELFLRLESEAHVRQLRQTMEAARAGTFRRPIGGLLVRAGRWLTPDAPRVPVARRA